MPATRDSTVPGGSTLDHLGVRLHDGVGTLRIWSQNASSVELVIFDAEDLDWATDQVSLERLPGGVWEVTTPLLQPGTRYASEARTGPATPSTRRPCCSIRTRAAWPRAAATRSGGRS